MSFRIINIVDDLRPVNMGIWNAALSTANDLHREFQVESELIAPRAEWKNPGYELAAVHLIDSTRSKELVRIVQRTRWSPKSTVIATHGCWRFATRWAVRLQRLGFPWVYSPQGMLEPWSLKQRALRKFGYFQFIERPAASRSQMIRAVGTPELENLKRFFPRHSGIQLIPNGIPEVQPELGRKSTAPVHLLFMGRLHEKKCVAELAEAFVSSRLFNNSQFEMTIAGPDDGQGPRVQQILERAGCRNAQWIGPQYGAAKQELLHRSSYFILPSHSEGFPTAVVEAMGNGCLPVISPGCNFPEAIAQGLAFPTSTNVQEIRSSLDALIDFDSENLKQMQKKAAQFIANNYTTREIARLQFEKFAPLLPALSPKNR